ncbi:hypothetical protein FRC04_002305 [Tulasnella sp. 424]|nr:hypothetical protein FRC04_002305 [Tulasnella sp. 424]KAG8977378.1 hypothetical protein FRC05_001776 [Tulasnella sp. 425]
MTTAANATIMNTIGVFVLARHGDKQGTYSNQLSYTATNVQLTALGQAQGFNLGARLQERYLKRTSSTYIAGVNPDLYVDGQALIRADLGDESSMIFDTALAITQGLWPATNSNNITLGDGTYVISPLQGYQYVPIQTVDPDNNLYLEGWTDCIEYNEMANEMNRLPDFLTRAQLNAAFLDSLSTYVGDRPTKYENIYDIWDYMNVNYVHDKAFFAAVPGAVIGQARDLANWYEFYTNGSPDPESILNIGGKTLTGEILNILNRVANKSDSLKFVLYAASYKPFLSFFQMTGVTSTHPELAGIVNYAAAMALELRQPINGTDLYVRFTFKNGTQDSDFMPYPMFGRKDGDFDIPLSTFNLAMRPYAISDTLSWCNACNTSLARNCDVYTQAAVADQLMNQIANQKSEQSHSISPAVGGVIGAIIALVLAAAILGLLALFGCVSFGRGASRKPPHRRNSSIPQIVVRMTKGKRDSADTESTIGIKANGAFEMMPDHISVLSRTPSIAPSLAHETKV